MKTKIVAIQRGYLARVDGGFAVFEVDEKLVFDVKRPVGIHELQCCHTLDDVRKLLDVVPAPEDTSKDVTLTIILRSDAPSLATIVQDYMVNGLFAEDFMSYALDHPYTDPDLFEISVQNYNIKGGEDG